MDPDAVLADLRAALRDWHTARSSDDRDAQLQAATRALDAATALDGWLSRGGFLPAAWQPNRTHS